MGKSGSWRTSAAPLPIVRWPDQRDRLARDIVVAATIEQMAARAGATVATTDGAGEGTTPEAAMLRCIVDVFAVYERDVIRGRTRAARAWHLTTVARLVRRAQAGFEGSKAAWHRDFKPKSRSAVPWERRLRGALR